MVTAHPISFIKYLTLVNHFFSKFPFWASNARKVYKHVDLTTKACKHQQTSLNNKMFERPVCWETIIQLSNYS